MNTDLVNVPKRFIVDGSEYITLSTMENCHYRALVLPVGADNPLWLSNEKVSQALLPPDVPPP